MVADVTEVDAEDENGHPITSLAMRRGDYVPGSAGRPKVTGRNQERALTAIREWARTHPADHVTSLELRELLAEHGIGRQRKPEVLKFLVAAGVLVPAVGGHTIQREAL